MAKGKDYFGLGRLVSIILAIIPVTAWLCGWLTRFKEGKIIAGIIRLLFGWNIIWILDLILMILQGKILRILNCQVVQWILEKSRRKESKINKPEDFPTASKHHFRPVCSMAENLRAFCFLIKS